MSSIAKNERSRRLATIMFTDMVGYSALASRNEKLSLDLVDEQKMSIRRTISAFGGQEIKTTGDGFMIEFASVLNAAQCAIDIQSALFERNLTVPEERRLQIRIGLHLGDVVDSERDRFGDNVNLAARVEPLARPGGISLTQQVADQIRGKIELPLRSLGRARLKNIDSPPEVFQLVMPWEEEKASLFRRVRAFINRGGIGAVRLSWEARLLAAQLIFVLGLFAWMGSELSSPEAAPPGRSPASDQASPAARVHFLPDFWEFRGSRARNRESSGWKKFRLDDPLEHADEMTGNYQLRLQFSSPREFRKPAMVIGLVGDSHSAFLNGKFIGGASNFSDLSRYAFDASLLHADRLNTLILDVKARHSLTPGIYLIPGTRPQIGEVEEIASIVSSHDRRFRLLQSIYLAVSFLIALACLTYAAFRRAHLKFLYFSLFLFLGSLGVSYYSAFVIAALDYDVYRFTRVLSFALSSFTLFSAYLHLQGDRRLERLNNAGAIAFGGALAAALLAERLLPSEFIPRYTAGLAFVTLYTAGWLAWVELSKAARPSIGRADRLLIWAFGAVIFIIAAASMMRSPWVRQSMQELVPQALFDQIRLVSMAYPFVFALIVLFRGVRDFVVKSAEIAYKKRKDDLILGMSILVAESSESRDPHKAVEVVQEKLIQFLKARRSTLYVLDGASGDSSRVLKASRVHGSLEAKQRVERSVLPNQGIIGYCVQNRSAVWVRDIRKDPRFQAMASARLDESAYETGSFIVVPLLLGSELVGVVTVADRADGRPFDREDFGLLTLAARDLAAIVGASALRKAA